ncbi:MAG: hypothetical protein M3033_07860 [Acidobacteriota bacterium]|nr:hypothetical protein [Acidobacteriota bacterium]
MNKTSQQNQKGKEKTANISLAPLDFEQALENLLLVKPEKKDAPKKKSKPKTKK